MSIETVDRVGVHTSHCCAQHGCKYGDQDCPVQTKAHEQEYPCEHCGSVEGIKAKLAAKQAELMKELAWAEELEARGISTEWADGERYM
jgi:hypothetical protein